MKKATYSIVGVILGAIVTMGVAVLFSQLAQKNRRYTTSSYGEVWGG